MRSGQEGPGIDRSASLILRRPRERWFGRSQLLNGFWPWEHQGDAQWFSVAQQILGNEMPSISLVCSANTLGQRCVCVGD